MTDRQIDFLVAGADPVGSARLPEGPLTASEAGLRDAIVDHAGDAPPLARFWPRWTRGHLVRRAVAVGLIGATGLGAAAVIGVNRLGDGAQPAWAAPVLRAAESSPRMLISEDGWSITRADQFGVDFGETVFENGRETIQLNWYPKENRPIEKPHPGSGTTEVAPTTLAGSPVVISYYGGERYRAAWHQGDWTLEFDGEAASAERFTEILHALRSVGVEEWLNAMPASTVRPDGRAAVVDTMLAGIPLPAGFDVAALRDANGLVNDRYQLGAKVAGSVACGWIGRWMDARAAGDAATIAQSVSAMATSHRWAILREMNAAGDYPEVLWELADAMPGNDDIAAGAPGFKIADSYRDGLGCDAP